MNLRLEAEHCVQGHYSWIIIATWQYGHNSIRNLSTLIDRYFRIRKILDSIPEQSNSSNNYTEDIVSKKPKRSHYAGITGVRIVASDMLPEVAACYLRRLPNAFAAPLTSFPTTIYPTNNNLTNLTIEKEIQIPKAIRCPKCHRFAKSRLVEGKIICKRCGVQEATST